MSAPTPPTSVAEAFNDLARNYEQLTERTAHLADDLRSLQSAYSLLVEAYRRLLPAPTERSTAPSTALAAASQVEESPQRDPSRWEPEEVRAER